MLYTTTQTKNRLVDRRLCWLRGWNKVKTWYFDKSPNLLIKQH